MSAPDQDSLRASDDDRAEVAERLRRALDDGRLDVHEYDRRLRDAYAAVTRGELAPLTADLPAPSGPDRATLARKEEKQARRAAKRKAEWVGEWRSWAGGAVIMIAIWTVTNVPSGEFGFFWPVIPLGIWAAVLVAGTVFGDR